MRESVSCLAIRVLLIEGDSVLRDVIKRSLEMAGHRVHTASTIEEALYWWETGSLDAVLLDLNLPKHPRLTSNYADDTSNGLALLQAARSRGDTTPVMVLTARDRLEDRMTGFEVGADDYLGKPFDLAEVQTRLLSMVRRSRGTEDLVRLGQLKLDRRAHHFYVAGKLLVLPQCEFDVLWDLMTPPGKVVRKQGFRNQRSAAYEHLRSNALHLFVARLRTKLCGSGVSIRSLRGIGYLIEAKGT